MKTEGLKKDGALGQTRPTWTPSFLGAALGVGLGLWLLVFLAVLLPGCAAIAPGQDPLIVQVERAETVGKATFDLAIGVDNADRGYWRTNAPGFHGFCNWLRQPQAVTVQFPGGHMVPVTLGRGSAMLVAVNNIKLEYKASLSDSNTVISALAVLRRAISEAGGWLAVVTNRPIAGVRRLEGTADEGTQGTEGTQERTPTSWRPLPGQRTYTNVGGLK